MNNKDIAMIYKALSHILNNQRLIMEHLNVNNFYAIQDTEELSEQFGKLAKLYYKEKSDD